MKILAIGDPHFKKDNANETALMVCNLRPIILEKNPDMIVILGDIGHDFEEVGNNRHLRMYDFINMIHETMSPTCKLFLLIGNHDRVHNKIFMTNEHIFNSYKKWTNTYVIDTTSVEIINDKKYVFVPYVETGKFNQALLAKDLVKYNEQEIQYLMEDVQLVFAHQEFMGAKMNNITSNKGDPWPEHLPLCISGHIHDYEQLQKNLIYVGTPIQHGYTDTNDKTISLFTEIDSKWQHERINLGICKKLCYTLTCEQLKKFTLPENAQVKIKLKGTIEEIKNFKNTDYFKELVDKGVKIKEDIVLQKISTNYNNSTKKEFRNRLIDNLSQQPEKYKQLFINIFN